VPVNSKPELVLLKNRREGRGATLDEYRAGGGYEALARALKEYAPGRITEMVKDSGLRGRGGAAFPAGIKWQGVRQDAPHPRYVVVNTDEMEPGTFKDRLLVDADPHQIIEGAILAGYAIQAQRGIIFIRPSYEQGAKLLEGELEVARQAGFLGQNILGSNFSFDLTVHRSAGRYICGEATAQVNAIMGNRPHPLKGVHMAEQGLWGQPTLVNNVETLACVPHIVRNGPEWFRGLARSKTGSGTKLYAVSGKVLRPGVYELPIGTPLREIIEDHAGGLPQGCEFRACLPGGASTRYIPRKFYDLEMDFEPLKAVGHRLGTGAIIVYDQHTCFVGATLNLQEFFARESCGWCTPCREGLPYIRDLLWRIENGEGKEEFIPLLRQMAGHMRKAFCAFAPGAAEPVIGLLTYFEDEVLEHISHKGCPYKDVQKPRPHLWYPPET
jgi:NADH-quinone oxidoreductase subunit F